MVLKKCEHEPSYILADLVNMGLGESCFRYCWKNVSVVHAFKNVGERSVTKNYPPVSLLYVFSKVYEKLINNKLVAHHEK